MPVLDGKASISEMRSFYMLLQKKKKKKKKKKRGKKGIT